MHRGVVLHAVPVDQVVGRVERHAGLERAVRAFEARLVFGIAGRERGEGGQVSACRTTGDRDEVGIRAEVLGVLAQPCERALHVDQMVGKGDGGAQAVVQRGAQPAMCRQVVHERQRLVLLLAVLPAAAMHLQQHRMRPAVERGAVHVELVALAGAAVCEVRDALHARVAVMAGPRQARPVQGQVHSLRPLGRDVRAVVRVRASRRVRPRARSQRSTVCARARPVPRPKRSSAQVRADQARPRALRPPRMRARGPPAPPGGAAAARSWASPSGSRASA